MSDTQIIGQIKTELTMIKRLININEWEASRPHLTKVKELCDGLSNQEFAKVVKQRTTTLVDITGLQSALVTNDHIEQLNKFIDAAKNLKGKELLRVQLSDFRNI